MGSGGGGETTAAKAAAGTDSVERGSIDTGESELAAGKRRVGEPPRSRRIASQARREGDANKTPGRMGNSGAGGIGGRRDGEWITEEEVVDKGWGR